MNNQSKPQPRSIGIMLTKRKLHIVLYGVALLVLLWGVLWPFETQLSKADIEKISAIVAEETSQPILSLRTLPRWGARVETGIISGPLSGGGHTFYLRWGFGGWRIYKSELWIS